MVVPVGESARFEAPIKRGDNYQWVKNSIRIEGATNSFYSINPVTKEAAGFYAVLVTSGYEYPEEVISCTATLYTYDTKGKGTMEVAAPIPMSASFTNSSGGVIGGGGTKGYCPSNYAGIVKFKTPGGSSWWPRPAGTTQCTITDQSPYTTKVEAVESGTLMSWCNTETVTFPTQALPRKYQFTTYFTTINPPVPGEIITLLINWF